MRASPIISWRSTRARAGKDADGHGIERLQLLGGEGDEFAAGVFVSLDHLMLVDLLAGCGIMRPKRDPGGGGALVSIRAGIVCEELRADGAEPCCPSSRSDQTSSATSIGAGCHTWCKRMDFARVVAGDK
jgi:hypothetical protein